MGINVDDQRWKEEGEEGEKFVARSRQVCIYWLWKHCLLLSILSEGRADTYRHKKILSVERLSRPNSWFLSS
jgi:hypothetical protein